MAQRQANRAAKKVELQKHEVTYGGTSVSVSVPGAGVSMVKVASWTASGNDYYYDLVHNKGRAAVIIQMYHAKNNKYVMNVKEIAPLTGSEITTLRIWLSYDPGADNIIIVYI